MTASTIDSLPISGSVRGGADRLSRRAAPDSSVRGPSANSIERFTLDGSDDLERHIAELCSHIRESVLKLVPSSKLEGLLLAGGYGRGEGGVLHTAEGDRPYNDLEFYVFIKGSTILNERRYRQALIELGERLSPSAGLDVEFKIYSLSKLRGESPGMFSYDLVVRHHWLIGDDSLLAGCEHHKAEKAIPLHEATRLLFNRATGLLFAKERLHRAEFTEEDADFVGRNLAKAQLGIGDALLAANGRYHWSVRKRHRRLCVMHAAENDPTVLPEKLTQLHQAGVVFKLHPRRAKAPHNLLAHHHTELTLLARNVWLRIESQRLGQKFVTPRGYALSNVNKCPEKNALKNVLVTARTFGLKAAFSTDALRYPRERLFNALALLLWEDWTQPDAMALLQRNLRTTATDLSGLVRAYESLWHRFN